MKVEKHTKVIPVEKTVVVEEVKETFTVELSRDEMMIIAALIGILPRSREIVNATTFYEGYSSFSKEQTASPDMSNIYTYDIYSAFTQALNITMHHSAHVLVKIGDEDDHR